MMDLYRDALLSVCGDDPADDERLQLLYLASLAPLPHDERPDYVQDLEHRCTLAPATVAFLRTDPDPLFQFTGWMHGQPTLAEVLDMVEARGGCPAVVAALAHPQLPAQVAHAVLSAMDPAGATLVLSRPQAFAAPAVARALVLAADAAALNEKEVRHALRCAGVAAELAGRRDVVPWLRMAAATSANVPTPQGISELERLLALVGPGWFPVPPGELELNPRRLLRRTASAVDLDTHGAEVLRRCYQAWVPGGLSPGVRDQVTLAAGQKPGDFSGRDRVWYALRDEHGPGQRYETLAQLWQTLPVEHRNRDAAARLVVDTTAGPEDLEMVRDVLDTGDLGVLQQCLDGRIGGALPAWVQHYPTLFWGVYANAEPRTRTGFWEAVTASRRSSLVAAALTEGLIPRVLGPGELAVLLADVEVPDAALESLSIEVLERILRTGAPSLIEQARRVVRRIALRLPAATVEGPRHGAAEIAATSLGQTLAGVPFSTAVDAVVAACGTD